MKKIIRLSKEIYSIEVAMKASYNYIEKVYIFFKNINEKDYEIEFESKVELEDIDKIVGEFKNELLHENIRKSIFRDTKNIRELILARALYGLALEQKQEKMENIDKIEENKNNGSYIDDSQKIGESWF